jgi:L,D-transpeptidase YcbB
MASSIRVAAFVAVVSLAALPGFAQTLAVPVSRPDTEGAAAVRAFLDANGSPQPLCATAEGQALWAAVRAFYSARGGEPAWMAASGPTPAGRRLLGLLESAGDEGLDAARYAPTLLGGAPRVLRTSSIAPADDSGLGASDVALTAALARFASDLAQGAVDPRRASVLWRFRPRGFDVLPVLRAAAETGRPDEALDVVRPAHPQYAALRGAWRRYAEREAAEKAVPSVPARLTLRPGGRSPFVPALRARLAFWGDLEGGPHGSDVYDAATVAAVKRFQARHGIEADGVIGPQVTAALDVPVRTRLRQIALSLERWRWQDRAPEGKSIVVNIPTFELHAYDGGREALSMRVITGKPDSPTPVFAQAMTSVVFSPYWNVPANIAEEETLPAARRDRAYLRRMNLDVMRGDAVVDPARVDWAREAVSFRQRPGPGNALGLVKFQLPNPFQVYLHDTPGRALFARATRALSHGCVRLEKPEALARWVLDGQPEWTPARVAAAMQAGRENVVPLAQPIPVTIGYFTAWVDEDGTVEFRPDVYRHDAAQSPLFAPAPDATPANAVITVAAAP